MKTQYIFAILLFGLISIFSSLHQDRYSIAVPIIYGLLSIGFIFVGFWDKKE